MNLKSWSPTETDSLNIVRRITLGPGCPLKKEVLQQRISTHTKLPCSVFGPVGWSRLYCIVLLSSFLPRLNHQDSGAPTTHPKSPARPTTFVRDILQSHHGLSRWPCWMGSAASRTTTKPQQVLSSFSAGGLAEWGRRRPARPPNHSRFSAASQQLLSRWSSRVGSAASRTTTEPQAVPKYRQQRGIDSREV
jgi:hypothetical protein